MAGKRGRKAKEPEVVEEVDSEQNAEEAPKKKRGRPNPKSDVKAEQKKSEQTKADDEESKDSESESKNEEEMEESNDEPKEKAEAEVMDEKENGADDDKDEEDEEVDEKPKRGRGRQKKEAPKAKKAAPKQAAKGKQKKPAKSAEASGSEEDDEDKVEIVEEKESVPKRKGRAAKNAHKNGDVESSPKRSSGRNKKVTSYAEESEDEVVEVKGGKRGRGGRSKKDAESDSKKVDKEIRVVLEHCKSCQVYRRNAVALKEAFERAVDDIDVSINPEKPRRGSFECVLVKEDGTEIVLWSGIDKGPPRKLKFPDHQELVARLQSELKL